MKTLRPISLLLFVVLFGKIASAQGLRFTYIGLTTIEKTPSRSNLTYGIGYEQNLGTHISASLEYFGSYAIDDGEDKPFVGTGANSGLDFYYTMTAPWHEFTYTSKFFFSGNDDNSWYLASGIGYRKVNYHLSVNSITDNRTVPNQVEVDRISNGVAAAEHTMVPLYLKLGARGSMDGFFGDYYIGLNYTPGAGNKQSGNSAIDRYVGGGYYRSLSFTFGIVLGIGWAD